MAKVVLKNVCKCSFENTLVLNEINLLVEDKSFIVLVGPSGCGSSTILRMISGLEEISKGEIYIDDNLINEIKPKNRDIAMLFQNYALYPHMSVFDNMAFGLKLRAFSKQEIKNRVLDAAKILNIESLLDRKPKNLSSSQRQRVALGRTIVREPKVLLLDEPLCNIDTKLRSQMRIELFKLHKKLGTTFIYATHDQTEAMAIGDKIVVMKEGIIQQFDTPQRLYKNPNNTFVASFIGSPRMNFISGIIVKDHNIFLFKTSQNSISLPDFNNNIFEKYLNKELILGIRPEDIYISPDLIKSNYAGEIESTVEITELIDSETYLYVFIDNHSIISKVKPETNVRSGDKIKIYLDLSKIHLFDKDTGLNILKYL